MNATEVKFGPGIDGTEANEVFVFTVDGRPAGVVQRYLIDDYPEWLEALAPALDAHHGAGIDYFIGEPDLVGRGIGPAMIRSFVPSVFERYPSAVAVVVDVDQANRASWRALEKAGLHRIYTGDIDDEGTMTPEFVYRLDRPGPAPAADRAGSGDGPDRSVEA